MFTEAETPYLYQAQSLSLTKKKKKKRGFSLMIVGMCRQGWPLGAAESALVISQRDPQGAFVPLPCFQSENVSRPPNRIPFVSPLNGDLWESPGR